MIILIPGDVGRIQDLISRGIAKNFRRSFDRAIDEACEVVAAKDRSEQGTPCEVIGGSELDRNHRTMFWIVIEAVEAVPEELGHKFVTGVG